RAGKRYAHGRFVAYVYAACNIIVAIIENRLIIGTWHEEPSVADKFDALTDEDVRQIAALVELLDRSSFDYLQVDVGHLKVTVGKGMPPAAGWSAPAPAMALEAPQSAPAPVAQTKPAAPNAAAHGEDVVAVKAPMIGRFYAQPEPGAAPFVTLGMQVSATT